MKLSVLLFDRSWLVWSNKRLSHGAVVQRVQIHLVVIDIRDVEVFIAQREVKRAGSIGRVKANWLGKAIDFRQLLGLEIEPVKDLRERILRVGLHVKCLM